MRSSASQMHESLDSHVDIKGSSDRSFGIVMAVFFALVGLMPLRHRLPVRYWALGISLAFLLVVLVRPAALGPLNRLWFRLGMLLATVMNPIVTALLFYVAFTPIGILMRLMGKDSLNLRFDSSAKSYWVLREPPGPPAGSMSNQF